MNRNVLGLIAMFSWVGMIILFVGVLLWGVNNDYLISGMHNVSQELNDTGIITSNIMNSIDESAEAHMQMADWFDWFWLLSYIIFVGATIGVSYYSEQEGEFGFLGMLFYGTMILLFMFSVSEVMTNWLAQILYNVVPNLQSTLPKFSYWLEWAGVFTFIHLLICILINKFNLNIKQAIVKKNDIVADTKGEIL